MKYLMILAAVAATASAAEKYTVYETDHFELITDGSRSRAQEILAQFERVRSFFTRNLSVREPILMLDGEGKGPANNIVVMSECSREYAPAGQALIAVSVVGIPDPNGLDNAVRNQLVEWFGSVVKEWKLLKTYRIPNALPDMSVGKLDPWRRTVRLRPGLYVCGDHRDQGSINGAMESGHRTAQAVAEDLAKRRT